MKSIQAIFNRKHSQSNINGPTGELTECFLNEALDIVFPGMIRKSFFNESDLLDFIELNSSNLAKILILFKDENIKSRELIAEYNEKLDDISKMIFEDASAILAGDPAAKSLGEIVLSYPGLYAIATYRVAHFFYQKKMSIFSRMLSELAHTRTGIDIHPGAEIGHAFFIDHGTGIVIGETAVIGNNVKIYQGVTLGALSVDKSLANIKRHPTIEDDCILYAHATILGGDTIIGKGSVIGGNVWLTRSVPADSIVYHRSEIKLDKKIGFNQEEELTYEI